MVKRQSEQNKGKTTEHHYELCRVQDPKKRRKYSFGHLLSITAEDLATVLSAKGKIIQVDKGFVRVKGAGGWG